MLAPATPINEKERLAALRATGLLHTEAEESFDRVTRLAARVLRFPTVLVSLVDANEQWFKSRRGMDIAGTPRNVSFCGHALLSDEALIIPDALADERFADNPLVTGAPHIRFYAGMPIRTAERFRIGTLCLIDYRPRTLSAEDRRTLQDLARIVEDLIQQRQVARAASSLLQDLRTLSERDAPARVHEVEHLLTHDVLTGLPNRTMLLEHIRRGTERWQRRRATAVVACIDLDHFKHLNESYGHHAGDRALVAVARYLTDSMRQHDMVARVGGDEFIMVIEEVAESQSAEKILQRITQNLNRPIRLGDDEVTLTCSIGFSRYPHDGADADRLLTTANAAMRHSKELGRATIRPYTPELTQASAHRLTLESQLRQALHRDELELHYQPKVDVRSGRVTGLEALVRWRHPELGMVPPSQFISIAEETGLIIPIGAWVLRTACRQLGAWRAAGIAPASVAVNLSSRQFLANDVVATVAEVLRETGLPRGSLELELTESVSMGNPEHSVGIMQQLKRMGVMLSIDDFGTGYSSLSYLKRLPIDKIKIDRSFVADMTDSEDALAIIQAVIAMAHRLHLKVVAEGVETAAQLAGLAAHDCDEIQGFFYSRPLDVAACARLLAQPPALEG